MTANPQPAVRVDARAEPADQWRKLALQFDMHRIDALSVLRGVVAGTVSTEDVRAFLAAPPRASALTPAPTEAGGVREALTAIIADWDSRSVGEQERFVPPSDGVPGYWSPNARMVPSERIAAGRAALSSTPAADAGWQDISTAPHSKRVLVKFQSGEVEVCYLTAPDPPLKQTWRFAFVERGRQAPWPIRWCEIPADPQPGGAR